MGTIEKIDCDFDGTLNREIKKCAGNILYKPLLLCGKKTKVQRIAFFSVVY